MLGTRSQASLGLGSVLCSWRLPLTSHAPVYAADSNRKNPSIPTAHSALCHETQSKAITPLHTVVEN